VDTWLAVIMSIATALIGLLASPKATRAMANLAKLMATRRQTGIDQLRAEYEMIIETKQKHHLKQIEELTSYQVRQMEDLKQEAMSMKTRLTRVAIALDEARMKMVEMEMANVRLTARLNMAEERLGGKIQPSTDQTPLPIALPDPAGHSDHCSPPGS